MGIQYMHLSPEEAPPSLARTSFCGVIVSEAGASDVWRECVADWLVQSGCLYAVCWGVACEKWHDSVDRANLTEFDYGGIPEDRFVMTTWHDKEPLREAFWFAGQCAFHPTVALETTVILHVSADQRESAMLETFHESQSLPDDHE